MIAWVFSGAGAVSIDNRVAFQSLSAQKFVYQSRKPARKTCRPTLSLISGLIEESAFQQLSSKQSLLVLALLSKKKSEWIK